MMVPAALLVLGVIMSQPISSAPGNSDSSGAPMRRLADLRAGAPVSFEQVEQHRTRSVNSGVIVTIRSKVYRDSAGRVRQEAEIQDPAGTVVKPDISIADPTDGSIVLLAASEGRALRIPLPISTESASFTGEAIDEDEEEHEWGVRSENIGKRIIEDIEFSGTRLTYIAKDRPSLTKSYEYWYSDALKLTGAISIIGLKEIRTVEIHNLKRNEPAPEFFSVPSGYEVINLRFPLPTPREN